MNALDDQRTESDIDFDVFQFIESRERSPRRSHCKFVDGNSNSLVIDTPGQPYVNRSEMSATAIISTSDVDKAGDVLLPKGCVVENYIKNPVVLWAHGLTGLDKPIGTSRSPSGKLAIEIGEEVRATCWFSQSLPEAIQIFHLIDEGIVRATSVREIPLKSKKIYEGGEQIIIVSLWDLEEWSWCAMGVNPDAVAKAIHRNRIDGRPISQPIMKCLLAVAPTLKTLGKGLDLNSQGSVMKMADGKETADTTPADDKSSKTDASKLPYGKQIIDATHSDLKKLVKNLTDCTGPQLEHQDVKSDLCGIRDSLKEHMTALEGMHATHYKDHKSSLKSDDDGGESDDDSGESEESEMKSLSALLGRQKVANYTLVGVESQLKALANSKNLTPGEKNDVQGILGVFGTLKSRAKSLIALDEENARKEAELKASQDAATKAADQAAQEAAAAALQKKIDEAKALLSS